MNVFKNKVNSQEDFDTIQKELITINTKLTNNRLLLNQINTNKTGFTRAINIVMNHKIAATAIGISAVATTAYGLDRYIKTTTKQSVKAHKSKAKNEVFNVDNNNNEKSSNKQTNMTPKINMLLTKRARTAAEKASTQKEKNQAIVDLNKRIADEIEILKKEMFG
jgi:hypothetical protein